MSFLVIALAVLAMMTTAYMNLVRPAQKRHRAALAVPGPASMADPKVPRDTSRPYPRGDSAATEEMLRTCPVCGMADLDQMLPDDVADFFGWPAHASCKEWLGDWKPPPPEVKELQRALDGFELDHAIPVLAPKGNRKARYPVVDISTVLTVDGFHQGGYQVAQHTIPYEDSADLPGAPLVSIEPRYSAATLLSPEPVMYGWSVWIRAATAEEAHKTLVELEDKARAGLPLATGKPLAGQMVPRSGNCCDGCGSALGTGVRYHDMAGHRYCGSCDREQRRRKQGAYAPPSAPPAAPPIPTPAEYLAELEEHLHHFQEQYPD